ncbi:NnrU protein [Pelagimonas phthalicica]|uniref:NnrU protein n=1 Tax=Pelagimonas phthalicica TaxID=1037362 RepID=A0A238JAL9_9RHOB|nr:NnrU family protein [Pelagimonas phthalicica]TDS94051.1 putative membrane protein [Pelagimonas phthalicica]SMX27423.1 NnrU protein [Pelagimonas phthalicica]
MEWIEFAVAMLLFMGSHRVPAALGVKDVLVTRLGTMGYTALFSLGSTLLLLWVIWAAGRAPFVPLWDQSAASRWAVNLVMPVVILLASFGVAAPNPFAFEGRRSGFDPDHPGIVGLTRQPLLWALALWSGVHLWANGDLAHVILFGTFAAFSVLGMGLVERRRARIIGADWGRLSARTSLMPFAALISGKWRPRSLPSWLRLTIAILAWAAVFHLHEAVIGVLPVP